MINKNLVMSFGVLISVNSFSSEAALSSSALLAFDAGNIVCDSSGFCSVAQGSYFSVDTDNSGSFSAYESIAISPGSDGGLLVGETQLASVPYFLDGTEITPIDSVWLFLGEEGAHQSTSPVNILSDDGSGHIELDFSGFGATWNGNTIGLGGDSVNFASETGSATVTCGVDCSSGDSFTLDYAAHVTDLNFEGVYWGIHLEGTVINGVVSSIPVPAAIWLFASGLISLAGVARRCRTT